MKFSYQTPCLGCIIKALLVMTHYFKVQVELCFVKFILYSLFRLIFAFRLNNPVLGCTCACKQTAEVCNVVNHMTHIKLWAVLYVEPWCGVPSDF